METSDEIAMAMFGKVTQNYTKALQGYIENEEWPKALALMTFYGEGMDAAFGNATRLVFTDLVLGKIDAPSITGLAEDIRLEVKAKLKEGVQPFFDKLGVSFDG